MITCQEMKNELEKLKRDLIKEINDSDLDNQELLKGIIKISSKYPEQQELIEFIVILTDALNRDSKNTKNQLVEVIDICFGYKMKMLNKIEEINNKTKKTTVSQKATKALDFLKNTAFTKIGLPLIVIIILLIAYLIFPDQTEHFMKDLVPNIFKHL